MDMQFLKFKFLQLIFLFGWFLYLLCSRQATATNCIENIYEQIETRSVEMKKIWDVGCFLSGTKHIKKVEQISRFKTWYSSWTKMLIIQFSYMEKMLIIHFSCDSIRTENCIKVLWLVFFFFIYGNCMTSIFHKPKNCFISQI